MSNAMTGRAQNEVQDALKNELACVRSDISRLRNPAKSSRRREKNAGVLTSHEQRLAVAVYVLSDYNATVAPQKVLSYPRCKKAGTTQLQAERIVEDTFRTLPDDFASTVAYPEGAATRRLATAAKRFLAELQTVTWVTNQNQQHGVAPSSSAARLHYSRILGDAEDVEDNSMSYRGVKRWVQRWRRRWGISRGKLHRQELLTPEMIVDKVSPIILVFGSFWCGTRSSFQDRFPVRLPKTT